MAAWCAAWYPMRGREALKAPAPTALGTLLLHHLVPEHRATTLHKLKHIGAYRDMEGKNMIVLCVYIYIHTHYSTNLKWYKDI